MIGKKKKQESHNSPTEGVDLEEPFILMNNGSKIPVFSPQPEDIDIEGIARCLSMQCRYNGNCDRFMSVAEHSVNCSIAAERYYPDGGVELQFAALLHDAAEAYVGDLIRPVKVFCDKYTEAEDVFEAAIEARFSIDHTLRKIVKEIDVRMCTTEMEQLFAGYSPGVLPNMPDAFEDFILNKNDVYPPNARKAFLDRFKLLQTKRFASK